VYDARFYADGREYQGFWAVRNDLDGLEADEVAERDGVDVEDNDKESGRGLHCFMSKILVAAI
jgi:hypothetical protein